MKTCKWCASPLVTSMAIAPSTILAGRHIPAAIPTAISACPTCDRPRCPNAGCGMPTGPLLPLNPRTITPVVCDHCRLPVVFGAHRP